MAYIKRYCGSALRMKKAKAMTTITIMVKKTANFLPKRLKKEEDPYSFAEEACAGIELPLLQKCFRL
jgi:hypothetical protein